MGSSFSFLTFSTSFKNMCFPSGFHPSELPLVVEQNFLSSVIFHFYFFDTSSASMVLAGSGIFSHRSFWLYNHQGKCLVTQCENGTQWLFCFSLPVLGLSWSQSGEDPVTKVFKLLQSLMARSGPRCRKIKK